MIEVMLVKKFVYRVLLYLCQESQINAGSLNFTIEEQEKAVSKFAQYIKKRL